MELVAEINSEDAVVGAENACSAFVVGEVAVSCQFECGLRCVMAPAGHGVSTVTWVELTAVTTSRSNGCW